MSSIGFLVAGVVLVGAIAPLRAQSLADVAKKEEERRRHVKTGKVYTNTDLAPAKDSSAAPAASSSANGDAGSAAGSDTTAKGNDAKAADAKNDEQGQAYWAKRMGGLRETLQRDQVYADALQTRINALTTDFVNRDDPAQRAQIGNQRETAVNELARLKKQIEDDRKAISDAEEEARKSGIPAGWLR